MENRDRLSKWENKPQMPHLHPAPPAVPKVAPKPVNVGVRWFYQDELIFDDMASVDGKRAYFIQPPPGEAFPEENYRVEIYLVKETLRTVHFVVER